MAGADVIARLCRSPDGALIARGVLCSDGGVSVLSACRVNLDARQSAFNGFHFGTYSSWYRIGGIGGRLVFRGRNDCDAYQISGLSYTDNYGFHKVYGADMGIDTDCPYRGLMRPRATAAGDGDWIDWPLCARYYYNRLSAAWQHYETDVYYGFARTLNRYGNVSGVLNFSTRCADWCWDSRKRWLYADYDSPNISGKQTPKAYYAAAIRLEPMKDVGYDAFVTVNSGGKTGTYAVKKTGVAYLTYRDGVKRERRYVCVSGDIGDDVSSRDIDATLTVSLPFSGADFCYYGYDSLNSRWYRVLSMPRGFSNSAFPSQPYTTGSDYSLRAIIDKPSSIAGEYGFSAYSGFLGETARLARSYSLSPYDTTSAGASDGSAGITLCCDQSANIAWLSRLPSGEFRSGLGFVYADKQLVGKDSFCGIGLSGDEVAGVLAIPQYYGQGISSYEREAKVTDVGDDSLTLGGALGKSANVTPGLAAHVRNYWRNFRLEESYSGFHQYFSYDDEQMALSLSAGASYKLHAHDDYEHSEGDALILYSGPLGLYGGSASAAIRAGEPILITSMSADHRTIYLAQSATEKGIELRNLSWDSSSGVLYEQQWGGNSQIGRYASSSPTVAEGTFTVASPPSAAGTYPVTGILSYVTPTGLSYSTYAIKLGVGIGDDCNNVSGTLDITNLPSFARAQYRMQIMRGIVRTGRWNADSQLLEDISEYTYQPRAIALVVSGAPVGTHTITSSASGLVLEPGLGDNDIENVKVSIIRLRCPDLVARCFHPGVFHTEGMKSGMSVGISGFSGNDWDNLNGTWDDFEYSPGSGVYTPAEGSYYQTETISGTDYTVRLLPTVVQHQSYAAAVREQGWTLRVSKAATTMNTTFVPSPMLKGTFHCIGPWSAVAGVTSGIAEVYLPGV